MTGGMTMADLLPDLSGWIIDQLAAALPSVGAGRRRPPDTQNYEGRWIRVTQTGGPTDWNGALWHPTVAIEAWADTSDDAFDLCAAATGALQQLEGSGATNFRLTEVSVMAACADAAIDSRPVCLTTATTTVEVHP